LHRSKNNLNIWDREWVLTLEKTLRGYLNNHATLSKQGMIDLVDNILELNDSLERVSELYNTFGVKFSNISSYNDIYELCKKGSKIEGLMQPIFNSTCKNLRKYLEFRGYLEPSELSNSQKLRQHQLERLDSLARVASMEIHEQLRGKNFCYLRKDECGDVDEVMNYVADVLIGFYCKKQVIAKK
jgi:hypothetical protein